MHVFGGTIFTRFNQSVAEMVKQYMIEGTKYHQTRLIKFASLIVYHEPPQIIVICSV